MFISRNLVIRFEPAFCEGKPVFGSIFRRLYLIYSTPALSLVSSFSLLLFSIVLALETGIEHLKGGHTTRSHISSLFFKTPNLISETLETIYDLWTHKNPYF